jgi:hypothetical protein
MPRRHPERPKRHEYKPTGRRPQAEATVFVSAVEFSPGFWEQVLAGPGRASEPAGPLGGNVTPDKAKGHQRQTDDLSAPRTSANEDKGVENKYSR